MSTTSMENNTANSTHLASRNNPIFAQTVSVPGNYLTVSQLVLAYTNWYFTGERAESRATSNYPTLVKKYLIYCLTHQLPILYGLPSYRPGVKASYVSPVKNFLLFYQQLGCPPVTADPPRRPIPPAGNELVLQFIYQAGQLRGEESKQTYQKSLNAFFHWLDQQQRQGDPLLGFDGLSVHKFIQQTYQQGLSPFTINLRLAALKALAQWVLDNPRPFPLTDSQQDGLRKIGQIAPLPTEKAFYKEALTRSQRDQLLQHCEDPMTACLISLMVYSGLRTVELTRLRLVDMDLEAGTVWVMGKGQYTRQQVKLFSPTVETLRPYLAAQPGLQPADPVFPRLSTRQVRHRVDAALAQAGLKTKGISAHSLRHTAAQLLLEAGVEGIYVQQHLRHARFDTTQLYTVRKTRELYLAKLPDAF